MGTWGVGIFADDEASDVRDAFRHYVADTRDVAAATDEIALDYGASFDAPQQHPAFFLALALTQWRAGWLDPRVKTAALQVIADGSDLARWNDGKDARKRQRVLTAAAQQLVEPSPAPRRFPSPWQVQLADFRVGEIIGRWLPQQRLAVMKVVAFRRTVQLKVRGPAVRLQKWTEPRMPDAAEAAALEYLRHPIGPNRIQTIGALTLTAPRRQPLDPASFVRPGIVVPLRPKEHRIGYTCISTWNGYTVDDILAAAVARWWEDPALDAKAFAPWYRGNGRQSESDPR
jgi:hypothetical protein